MKFKLFVLSLLSTAAFGQNYYYGVPTYGGAQVQGYNANTGSNWNTNYNSQGMTGTDSRGNAWEYNRQSGNYYNYGTGRTCYGHGASRQCY